MKKYLFLTAYLSRAYPFVQGKGSGYSHFAVLRGSSIAYARDYGTTIPYALSDDTHPIT